MMESGSNLVEQPFFAVKNKADHWALSNVDLLESEILLSACVDVTRSCTLLHFGLFSWFDAMEFKSGRGIWEELALSHCVWLHCCWCRTIRTPNQWTNHHIFSVHKFVSFYKKKCRDALNKLCTYYCYGPPPPGGAGAGDLSTTLTAECFWGGGIGDLNLLSAHANCGSYLVQQTDVQRQHGRVQTAR